MKKRDKLDLEEELSEERTLLSNERTFLAYIRTAFTILIAGIAIINLFNLGILNFVGFALLVAGAFFLVLGLIYYIIRKRKIREGKL